MDFLQLPFWGDIVTELYLIYDFIPSTLGSVAVTFHILSLIYACDLSSTELLVGLHGELNT